jgi:type IV pilus assembly protein PilB
MSIAGEQTTRPVAAPVRRRLGEVLVELGVIDEDQLAAALEAQRTRGQRLGEVLLDQGLITTIDLLAALARQFGLDFVNLEEVDVDRSLVQRVPEPLARRHRAVPVLWDGDTVVVAMANPSDVIALDDIRSILRTPVRPVMADPGQVDDVISRSSQGDEQVQAAIRKAVVDASAVDDEPEIREAAASRDDAPIVRFVDLMIAKAVQERASDIHVEATSTSLRVRYRIDGVLHEVMHPPRKLHAGIVSRIKVMASLDIAEKRIPQDGRISLQLHGRAIDLRVATVPTVHGEAVVMRILRRDEGLANIADLGMEASQFARFQAAFRRTWGIVLVTGPTGSGKTTTLYSALRELNDPGRNIMTIEDPVEYRLEGIKQMQVNTRAGLTFARALKAMLRADPDIVLVGEIRDRETATIAVEASLTGHLVLASLHTNDAASTPIRLIEMGVEPYLVVAGLRGVLAQRLARRLCDKCRVFDPLPAREATAVGIPGHLLAADGTFPMHRPVGCPACSGTGYRGRFAVNEFLEVSEEIAQLILDQAPSREIERVAVAQGMFTLREAGLRKVAEGLTSLEDLLRCIS